MVLFDVDLKIRSGVFFIIYIYVIAFVFLPSQRTFTFEVSHPSLHLSLPITVCHQCQGQVQATLRGPAAETEMLGLGWVYIRVLKRGLWKEEWCLSRTRKDPMANTRQRKDSSSNSTTINSHPSPHTTDIPTPISTTHTIHSTHYLWKRSVVSPWRGTKRHLQWSTAKSTHRA